MIVKRRGDFGMPFRFFGGIHPKDKKSPANSAGSIPMAPPPQVAIPMSQHIGAPCTPSVAIGESVKFGQKIADSGAPVSAPIHATVSGKVVKIEPGELPDGRISSFVVIENDGNDSLCETILPRSEEAVSAMTAEEITKIIREAGIVGMGGAAFPTAFKIESSRGKTDTIIINGAECEPYITSDHRTMLEHPDEMIKGIELIMRACETPKVIFGIESNKTDAAELLKAKCAEKPEIEIRLMPCRYPQGAEKQLVQTLTGREVPPGGLPAAVGCSVFNAFTAYMVYRAVYEGMPVVERVVTVSGSGSHEPKNYLTRIGTPLTYVFEQAGGLKEDLNKVIMGGPMMGIAIYNLDVSTMKGTNAILAFSDDEDKTVSDPTCIRCGKCAEVCPMRLLPVYMHMYEQKNDFAGMERYNLTDCIECGACTYTCPGRLHLTHSFRAGKAKLAEKAAADKARAESGEGETKNAG